jgi:predicted ABC-class ATPase
LRQAIELGAEALMMDEDNCAANAMIRDAKMMQLVAPGKEPITPFVRIVRALYEQLSLSTILVIGGTGDYFDVADHVLVMDSYQCYDATDRAKKIVTEFGGPVTVDAPAKRLHLKSSRPRCITRPALLQSDGKVRVARSGLISYGNTEINLTAVEQIVSASQTSAIASIVEKLGFASEGLTLRQALQSIDEEIERDGLEALGPGQFNGGFTRPRILEVGAAVNRLRARGAINQTSV